MNTSKLLINIEKFKFVIFFGHGKSDILCGSKGKYYDNLGFNNEVLFLENPRDYYYKETFIDKSNINIFKNKNIFCLSCNSNEKIANYAIDAGANSFIGFGNIPTSIEEFIDLKYENVSSDLVRNMKTEINYIIKTSLNLAIKNNSTIEQLGNNIIFFSNQRIADILVNQKKYKDRFILTDNIYLFKKEMKIFGNKNSKLFY